MAGVLVKQNSVLLTGNATAAGLAPVADSSLFPVGCTVFLRSSTTDSVECIVTDLPDSTHVGLRIKVSRMVGSNNQYGVRSDMSAYLLADAAQLNIPSQVADEYSAFYKK